MVFNELYRLILGGEYGYYVDATEQTILELVRRCNGSGMMYKDVESIIKELLAIGALDNMQYNTNKIYTNRELQTLHIEAGSRRVENYIYKKHFLLTKEDLLNLKNKRKFVKRDKKCIFIDKKAGESAENLEENPLNSLKNNDKSSVYDNKCNILDNKCNIYEDKSDISSRAKLDNTRLNNTKQNEIKENLGKSISESNSISNSMPGEPVKYDFPINNFVNSLLKRQLIPTDYITVKVINNTVDELEKGIDNSQLLLEAEHSVMRAMIFKKEKITEYNAYIRKGLKDKIEELLNNEESDYEED